MNRKPDLLVVLSMILTVGLAISTYTHSRGLLQPQPLPAVNFSTLPTSPPGTNLSN